MPNIPRLARRARTTPSTFLLACPTVSPEWELLALSALIKPQRKEAILHRPALQKLPKDARERVEQVSGIIAERTGFRPDIHWPVAGDYLFAADADRSNLLEARALGLMLSNALPGAWLVVEKLFIRDARFFRRERGIKLNLVPAQDVHLSRPLRKALLGVL